MVEKHIPRVCLSKFLLAVLEECFKGLNALIPRNQLALSNGNFLLQAAVLVNQLPLHGGELLQVALKESHLLLLLAVVRCS